MTSYVLSGGFCRLCKRPNGAEIDSRRYTHHAAPCRLTGNLEGDFICPRHPEPLPGSHQTAGSEPAPRDFHPRRDLRRLPSLRVTVTGQEYQCPHCRSSPCRELPGSRSKTIDSLRTAHRKADKTESKMKSCCFRLVVHPGVVAALAHAHRNSNRKVLDEWVFGCQGT